MPDSTLLCARGRRISRWLRTATASVFTLALSFLLDAQAAIIYETAGSEYSEDFGSLPTDVNNNSSIESFYVEGWKDDTTSVTGTNVSVPGWYLYHPLSPANENGFNGNQRFRMGSGQNTGGFWGFASDATDTEKALGSIGSTTVTGNGVEMYMALRLVNNTGLTLNEFTVTYDGEQWRDGQAETAETLSFGYSLAATAETWFSSAPFENVASLSFTAPFPFGTGTSGTAVNGNSEGLVAAITGTVRGVSWAPGTELWLRWADPQLAGNADDGLAIDNVQFVAVPEPTSVGLLAASAFAFRRRRRRLSIQ